jgi:hypothetical protein
MARLRAATLVLPLIVAPVSAADVSGVWALVLRVEWTAVPELVCTFSQDDEALTGSCRPARIAGRQRRGSDERTSRR